MLVVDEIIFSCPDIKKIKSEPDDVKLLLTLIHRRGLLSAEDYRRALMVANEMEDRAT